MLEEKEPGSREGALASLGAMYNFCCGVECRHRALVSYFGQSWKKDACDACDVCLGELDTVDEPLIVGQKILSCVLRVEQRFGGDYVSMVLTGSSDQRILQNGHDRLSTWGLLADQNRRSVRDWIEQLVSQQFLEKVGEYNVLQVTAEGRRLLHGEAAPRLLIPAAPTKRKKQSGTQTDSWEGVDRDLFEQLRRLRGEKAIAQQVPAYIVFSDAALRDMARRRPSTLDGFRQVRGVGEKKTADFGEQFIHAIREFCQQHNTEQDQPPLAATDAPPQPRGGPSVSAVAAFKHFDQGLSIEEVAKVLHRAQSTTYGYLDEYIRHRHIQDPSPWVNASTAQRIAAAAEQHGLDRLKPIFEAFNGDVPYDQIRVVVGCLRNQQNEVDP